MPPQTLFRAFAVLVDEEMQLAGARIDASPQSPVIEALRQAPSPHS
jgi:hypothetical protein